MPSDLKPTTRDGTRDIDAIVRELEAALDKYDGTNYVSQAVFGTLAAFHMPAILAALKAKDAELAGNRRAYNSVVGQFDAAARENNRLREELKAARAAVHNARSQCDAQQAGYIAQILDEEYLATYGDGREPEAGSGEGSKG